jgi:glyoxalase family protein
MRLDGIHHITCITGDAPKNVDFYVRTLGLRLVKKSVNQDDPTVYHLFYADERGSSGSDITFFEYPDAARGRAGAGMVHRIVFRAGSTEAIDFWADRLGEEGVAVDRTPAGIEFADPEGLGLAIEVVATDDPPLIADHVEIPAAMAIQGFDRVHAYARDPDRSRRLLEEGLGFAAEGPADWEVRGPARGGRYVYDTAPDAAAIPGAGTVHHVAWSSKMDDIGEWRARAAGAGARPTGIIDRYYFRSVYFREPSGVLFEIATQGPGFATDEPPEHLGERLALPPDYEHLRDRLEPILTPLPDVRAWRPGARVAER